MESNDGGKVEILQEEVDEDYEPTDKEIREYAEWLGIDADADPDLLWIARRGLMTPLPKPWRPCQSADGEIFYFNPETGENTWDHPCDEELRKLYNSERARKAAGGAGDSGNSSCDSASATAPVSADASTATALPPPRLPPTPPMLPPQSGTNAPPAKSVYDEEEEGMHEHSSSTAPESHDAGKKLAPLGLLGPLPPLAPPRAGSTAGDLTVSGAADGAAPPPNKPPHPAADFDDLFDMPLQLGGSTVPDVAKTDEARGGDRETKSRPPLPTPPLPARDTLEQKATPLSPLSPIQAGTGGDFLSPIAATEESLSPDQVPAAQQELEQLRSEIASEAAARKAQQETLENIRAISAAQLVAQAQVNADLDAELAAVRAELTEAKAAAAASASAAAAFSRQVSPPNEQQQTQTSPDAPHVQTKQPKHEDFLPSDFLSPPTPELVSILVAELRPSASSQATPPPAATEDTANQEQPSLWSQLEEEKGTGASPSGAAGAASSSLDVSSLSAVAMDRSVLDPHSCSPFFCIPGIAEGSPAHDEWLKGSGRRSTGQEFTEKALPGAKLAAATKAQPSAPPFDQSTVNSKELSRLRAELAELRAEMREAKSVSRASEKMAHETPHSVAKQERECKQSEVEADVDSLAATADGLPGSHALDTSSRCSTLKMEGRWTEPTVTPSIQVLAPVQNSTSPTIEQPPIQQASADAGHGTDAHGSGVGPKSEHLRLQLQALAASRTLPGTTTPLEATLEPVVDAASLGAADSAKVRLISAAEERATRAQRESRETRHRLEAAEAELERLSWELHQWREDADDSDRLLRDTRAALHKEQASHVAAKAIVRESKREVARLSSQLKTKEAEDEFAISEVQRVRSELADQEAEKQRLLLQLQARESELGQLRHRRKVNEQLTEAELRQHRLALTEREEVIGGRERFIDEREHLAGEAEALLRQQRRTLRSELERAELAGLRAAVTELSAPLAPLPISAPSQSRSGSFPLLANVGSGERFRASGRRKGLPEAAGCGDAAWPICSSDESFPPKESGQRLYGKKMDLEAPTPSSSSATSPIGAPVASGGTSQAAPCSGSLSSVLVGMKADGIDSLREASKPRLTGGAPSVGSRETEQPRAALAAAAAAAGGLPDFMRNWRKELRHEHAALEEDREKWRCEARRIKREGEKGVGEAKAGSRDYAELEILTEVRTALDSRAAVLNSSIGEYRALEKLHASGPQRRSSSQRARSGAASRSLGGSRRRASSSSSVLGAAPSGIAPAGVEGGCHASKKCGLQEEDLLSRWQHVLQHQQGTIRSTPAHTKHSNACRTVPPLSSRVAMMNLPLEGAAGLRAGVGGG
jgi:centrosomal protein CEP164